MDCRKCGGPLPPNSNICTYCGSLNDIDLRHARPTSAGPESDRLCPLCNVPMPTVRVDLNGTLDIERCNTCLGIFFDPGELDDLLKQSATHVHDINHERLRVLAEEETPIEHRQQKYIPCPICRKTMNRKRHDARAGVVADICRNHGVWLDGGELRRLVQWVKAGGQLHADNRRREDTRLQERRKKQVRQAKQAVHRHVYDHDEHGVTDLDDVLGGMVALVRQFFR